MPRKAAARRAGSASARRAPVRRWRVFLIAEPRESGERNYKGMDFLVDGPGFRVHRGIRIARGQDLRLSLRSLRIGRSWFLIMISLSASCATSPCGGRAAAFGLRRCRGPRAGAETARSLVYQSPETIFSDITIHFGPIERAASGQASAAPLAAGEGGRRRGACAARPAMHTDRPARRPWVLALRYRTAYQLRQAGQSRTRSQHRHFAG